MFAMLRRLKLHGQKQLKGWETERCPNASNNSYFNGYVQHVVNHCHEMNIFVGVTQPMGPLPKTIVLCLFLARGLAQR